MSITQPSRRATRLAGVLSSVLAMANITLAAPDFRLVGFATQNGGTTGGKGGTTVTLTNYADLEKNAESTSPMIIQVQGTITNGTGGGQIRITAVLTSTTADVKTLVPQYAGVGKIEGTTSVEHPLQPNTSSERYRNFDLLGRTAPSASPERLLAPPKVQGP